MSESTRSGNTAVTPRCLLMECPLNSWHIIHHCDDQDAVVTHIDSFSGMLQHNPRQDTYPSMSVAVEVLTANGTIASGQHIPCFAVAGYVVTGFSASVLLIMEASVKAILPPHHKIYSVTSSKWIEIAIHDPLVHFTQWYSKCFQWNNGVVNVVEDEVRSLVEKTSTSSMHSQCVSNNSKESSGSGSAHQSLPTAGLPLGEYRRRLTLFFEVYDSNMVTLIPELLRVFAGREEILFQVLVQRYGPEPVLDSGVGSYSSHHTSNSGPGAGTGGGSNSKGAHYEDAEKELRRRKMWRTRLVSFYRYYAPEKLGAVDDLMTAFYGKEIELFRQLIMKYGPEPDYTEGFAISFKAMMYGKRLRRTDVNDHFYFSFTTDLTQCFPAMNNRAQASTIDHNFVWNWKLLRPFRHLSLTHQCAVLIRGYAMTHAFASLGHTANVTAQELQGTLLVRQCTLNPGTRLIARGLATNGTPGAGNEYECELILFGPKSGVEYPACIAGYFRLADGGTMNAMPSSFPHSCSPAMTPKELLSGGTVPTSYLFASYRWARGTVPLRWSSKLKAHNVSPSVEMDDRNPYRGVLSYWNRFCGKYKTRRVLCVNLLKNNIPNGHSWFVESEVKEMMESVMTLIEEGGLGDDGNSPENITGTGEANGLDNDGISSVDSHPRNTPALDDSSSETDSDDLGSSDDEEQMNATPNLEAPPNAAPSGSPKADVSSTPIAPTYAGEPLLGVCYERSLRAMNTRSTRMASQGVSSNTPSASDLSDGSVSSICHLDWHMLVGKQGIESAAQTLWEYIVPHMERCGFTIGTITADLTEDSTHSVEIHTRQTGVLRANCADSLDRTNLVTFLSAIHAVPQMLLHLYCLSTEADVSEYPVAFPLRTYSYSDVLQQYPKRIISALAALFYCCGDACATLYCNSPAMHSGPIRSLADPKLIPKSNYNNALISLKRRYECNVGDAHRTFKLEMLLARVVVHLGPPLPGQRRVLTQSELQRSIIVLDSLQFHEYFTEVLLTNMNSYVAGDTINSTFSFAEHLVQMFSQIDEVEEVHLNVYTSISSLSYKNFIRPLCLITFRKKEMYYDYAIHKLGPFSYYSAMVRNIVTLFNNSDAIRSPKGNRNESTTPSHQSQKSGESSSKKSVFQGTFGKLRKKLIPKGLYT